MVILKNQPIKFWSEGTLPTNQSIPFGAGDPYQFQLKESDVYPDMTNWATNGDFSSATGWSFTGSGLSISGGVCSGTASGSVLLYNTYYFKPNTTYRIEIDITSNNGEIGVMNENYTSTGTKSQLYTTPFSSAVQFFMVFDSAGTYEVDEVRIVDISDNYSFKTYITTPTGTYVDALEDGEETGSFITYAANIDDLGTVNNTYQIKVLDPLVNNGSQNYLPNGRFNNKLDSTDPKWTESVTGSNTFTVQQSASGTREHELVWDGALNGLPLKDNISQGSILEDGTEYIFTYTINSITDASVQIKCGTTAGTSESTTGDKTDTITCAGSLDLTIEFTGTSASAACSISNVTIAKTTGADYVADYESNYFDYNSLADCDSFLIRALSADDNQGLGFTSSTFTPCMRVKGQLEEAKYDTDSEEYVDTNGRKNIYFMRSRKSVNLRTELYHEYVHDFLRLLNGFDNVYVDNDEYTANASYRIDFSTTNYGTGDLELEERTQNSISSNMDTTSIGIDISASGSLIIDPVGDFLIDPANSDNISIP